MILSRSADYALRAMIYLARNRSTRFIALHQIAAEMRTPPFLLGRLMQHLVKGGLITSMKGHHGGFRLQKEPDEIKVLDIVRLIDGPFMMFDCTGDAVCGLAGNCTMLHMFTRAENALSQVFASVTLAELSYHPHLTGNGGSVTFGATRARGGGR